MHQCSIAKGMAIVRARLQSAAGWTLVPHEIKPPIPRYDDGQSATALARGQTTRSAGFESILGFDLSLNYANCFFTKSNWPIVA